MTGAVRMAVAGALLAAISACGQPQAVAPAPSFRSPAAVIGSQSDVRAAQLTGAWHVRARFADDGIGFDDRVWFDANGDDLVVRWEEFGCGEIDCLASEYTENYRAGIAGRWRRAGVDAPGVVPLNAPQEIWVFWTDADRRTMAIGSPDGRYAVILDRNPEGGGDRLRAAREILDWYGFDVAGMGAN